MKALTHENIVRLREIVIYDTDLDREEVNEQTAQSTGLVHGDIFMMFEYCDFDLSGLLRSPSVVGSVQTS